MSNFDSEGEFVGTPSYESPRSFNEDEMVPLNATGHWEAFRKHFVDTVQGLMDMLDDIPLLKDHEARLCLDLEGDNLCRHGTIAIIQLFIPTMDRVFLIDVHTMGKRTFDVCASDGDTALKTVVEDVKITKILFDLQNDSDALFGLYGIRLRASRTSS
jgi:hypothetical protein